MIIPNSEARRQLNIQDAQYRRDRSTLIKLRELGILDRKHFTGERGDRGITLNDLNTLAIYRGLIRNGGTRVAITRIQDFMEEMSNGNN